MKRITLFFIFVFGASGACCAQSNKSESLIVTTYYPAPYGVFRVLRFLPNDSFIPGNACSEEGAISFENSTSELYICKGPLSDRKWNKLGSGSGGSVNKVLSDQGAGVIADTCSGVEHGSSSGSPPDESTCTVPFYKDITFNSAFNSTPNVAVTVKWATNSWRSDYASSWPRYPQSNCAVTDNYRVVAYATNIKTTGFRLVASGTGSPDACGPASEGDHFTHVYAGWMAVGD
jgi:hypothetical protein